MKNFSGRRIARITEQCINCGACAAECPSAAIMPFNVPYRQGGRVREPLSRETYYIVPSLCTLCKGVSRRLLCTSICPMNAISITTNITKRNNHE